MNIEYIEQEEQEWSYTKPLYYHNITKDDMLNGKGLRVVLWVAGCEHQCEGCQNPLTWNPNSGLPFTPWEEAELWEWIQKPHIKGLTLSGGDPLHPNNRERVGEIANQLKKNYPSKDLWVYTGYSLVFEDHEWRFQNRKHESFSLSWLPLIDVLVDGPFNQVQRKEDLQCSKQVLWRGDSGQRVIAVPKSIQTQEIVLESL